MTVLNMITEYHSNNRLEIKSAADGLPLEVWESYSAFANTNGGVIILGVTETENRELIAQGLDQPDKLAAEFWQVLGNPEKVSRNVLTEKSVRISILDGRQILTIEVPRAERTDKPVYLGGDRRRTYRRNSVGNYLCPESAIRAMTRDAAGETRDRLVLLNKTPAILNAETVYAYRGLLKNRRPGHVWQALDNMALLCKLGALARGEDGGLHPTAAGLLLFGNEREIRREFPNYCLDYQEGSGLISRPSEGLLSDSGLWSGNLFDFYLHVYQRAALYPPVLPPVRQALAEALVNCLTHADYPGEGPVTIKNSGDRVSFENPGGLRLSPAEVLSGGLSSPRNELLHRMFRLIAGAPGGGIASMVKVWQECGMGVPQLSERLENYESTRLVLALEKVSVKSGVKYIPKKGSVKTKNYKDTIIFQAKEKRRLKSADLTDVLPVCRQRIRKLLLELVNAGALIAEGGKKNRTYRVPGQDV